MEFTQIRLTHTAAHTYVRGKKINKEKTFPATSTAFRRAAHCVVRVLQQSRKVVAASKENVLYFGGLSATLLMADIKSVLSLLGLKKKRKKTCPRDSAIKSHPSVRSLDLLRGDLHRTPSLNICFGDACHVWKTLAFIIRSGEKRKQNIPSALQKALSQ